MALADPKTTNAAWLANGQPVPNDQVLALKAVLDHHGVDFNRLTLAKACLECGSIAESPTQNQRDLHVLAFDLACCDPSSTVTFTTAHLGNPHDPEAEAPVHIHQGGTLETYCGQPLPEGSVSWEDAAKANCPLCKHAMGS